MEGLQKVIEPILNFQTKSCVAVDGEDVRNEEKILCKNQKPHHFLTTTCIDVLKREPGLRFSSGEKCSSIFSRKYI